jgi:hypothetical protein
MPLVLADRVYETTTTTGTGTITLAGAVSGFQSFSVVGNGNTTYYTIAGGTEWEVGLGTYTASGTVLSRDSILESSNSGSAVNFSAGTKDVFVTYPAERAVFTSDTQTLTNKRYTPRVSSTASISSPLAWDSNNFDQYAATAQAGALTINADAGTPTDGQRILFRFEDNGTARALTWTTGSSKSFRAVGVTLPTTTVINKVLYVGCIYNAADDRWDALAVGQEA